MLSEEHVAEQRATSRSKSGHPDHLIHYFIARSLQVTSATLAPMWRLALLFSLFFLPHPTAAGEEISVEPLLLADLSRLYTAPRENWPEQMVIVDQAGSTMILSYSSDVPLTIKISYPFIQASGTHSYNPLHSLILYDVPPAQEGELTIDLTRSPAWSPKRKEYFLQVQGQAGSTVLIHDIYVKNPSFTESMGAALRQFFIDEPMGLSSVNFLWGYRVFDTSVSVILGVVMFVTGLLVTGYWLLVSRKGGVQWKRFVLIPLIFLLLYDARFSLDLVQLSIGDARSWFGAGEYRQLGPIIAIADFLQTEAKKGSQPLSIEVCSDGADLAQKQLRYMLYPHPVRRVGNNRSNATHLVLIDTLIGPGEESTVDCGAGPRYVEHLASFQHGASVFRY